MRAVDIDGRMFDRSAGDPLGFGNGVHDGFGHIFDMHDGAAPHTLVGRLAVTDDRWHITAVRVEHTDHAANVTGTDVQTNKMFWFHCLRVYTFWSYYRTAYLTVVYRYCFIYRKE